MVPDPGLSPDFRPAPVPQILLRLGEAGTPGAEAGDTRIVLRRPECFGRGRATLRMHPSIVAHNDGCTRIVVQIDTQQLPTRVARALPAPMPP